MVDFETWFIVETVLGIAFLIAAGVCVLAGYLTIGLGNNIFTGVGFACTVIALGFILLAAGYNRFGFGPSE